MKAVWVKEFAPIGQSKVEDVPSPAPGPGQVLIDVRAAEANFPDLLVMEGNYQVKPPLPFSPGKAASGVVAAVGEGVTSLTVGQKVAAQVEYGAYAELLVAEAGAVFPMPQAMPFDVGAALGLVYQTSHFALVERAGFTAGQSVLVLGASGGIGSAAVQLAKALGASCVIGAVLGADTIGAAQAMGCDHVIDLAEGDINERLRAEVRAHTGGGVDIVIDPVGGEATNAALRALAWRGRLVIIGFAAGQIPTIKANYLLVKNISVSGLQWSDYRERDPAWVARVQAEIFDLWQQNKLAPHISDRLPLDDFATALNRLRDGKVTGKIVLQPGPMTV